MAKSVFTKYAVVGTTATSVTFTGGTVIDSIRVISADVSAPVYFRCDGATAVALAEGCSLTVGVGGESEVSIPPAKDVTVSLVSSSTGNVAVIATERS